MDHPGTKPKRQTRYNYAPHRQPPVQGLLCRWTEGWVGAARWRRGAGRTGRGGRTGGWAAGASRGEVVHLVVDVHGTV